VLEPQSTFFFLLLMVAFAGLLIWMALTRQIVFRVLAACLAFIPAMVFGIAAVNKYYDYYQTWGAMYADLSGETSSIPHLSAAALGATGSSALRISIADSSNAALDSQLGFVFRTTVTGPRSHISRAVYIYLPPQYFWKKYANYRFPAIVLLHGSPGKPTAWIGAMDLIPIYQSLLAAHKAEPAVLVMPDTDGGYSYSLQCLNDPEPHGLQDMTWVGQEVPDWVAANLRVMPPGSAWGITGYSEGGFCAVNIALQYPNRFAFSGVMSGYFHPTDSQVPYNGKPNGRPIDVDVFQHDYPLGLRNTPSWYILHYPLGRTLPQFFLAAGNQDSGDVQAADYFYQELLTRDADTLPVDIVDGGGHVASVWRAALTPILIWMTRGITENAQVTVRLQQEDAKSTAEQRAAAKRAAEAAARKAHHLPGKLVGAPDTK
jgi:enterochelin esterase-like enzyme